MIDRRHIAGLAQTLRDVGWPWNENWILQAHGRFLREVAQTIRRSAKDENFFEIFFQKRFLRINPDLSVGCIFHIVN
jgi:hypothetical protein